MNDNYQQEIELLEEEILRLNSQREDLEYKRELFAAKVLKIIEMVAVPDTVIIDDQGKVLIRVARQARGNLGYFDHDVPFYADIHFAELKDGHIALHQKVDRDYADSADYIRCTICGSIDGQIIQDTYTLEPGVMDKTDRIEEHALCENCYAVLIKAIVN